MEDSAPDETLANADSKSMFEPISGDDTGLTEISSLCVNCEEQGTTRLLLVQIPFYREVIVSSFSCPHCFHSNQEIQSAGMIQEKGAIFTLAVTDTKDLNRQVVRSDSASVRIPELDFEIPASSQKGTLSTVEGIITRAVEGLQQEQPIRQALYPDVAVKISTFIEKLNKLLTGAEKFSIVVDDPSGNSFIENPNAPSADPHLSCRFYKRTLDQDKQLGLKADDAVEEPKEEIELPAPSGGLDLRNEVVTFQTECPACGAPNNTNMKMVQIPHFKEVLIMATDCEHCGNRTNEVKSGTGFEPKGKRITLKVTKPEDMTRDILKSETCTILIPELDMETGSMAISGKFTTLEGILDDLKKMVSSNPFVSGDSATSNKLLKVAEKLTTFAEGKTPFTFILDDPNSSSFIQNFDAPDEDPNLHFEEYERTFEQNEELGLNDMKTENYANE